VTALLPLAPTPGSVILGVGAVLAGALVATVSASLARHTRNWLHHLGTIGGLLIVAGVAGQRTVADGVALGPWDAGIGIPLIGVRLDPVAAAGIVIALLGLTLVLLFERVPDGSDLARPLVHRSVEDDDAV
jgi:formate hydrogenlyase subunit 3/multisubunit Na+/H+ antiporter MnhD subunit